MAWFLRTLTLFAMLSFSLCAFSQVKILSVWKSSDASKDAEFFALLDGKESEYSGNKVLFFGKKDNQIKIRYFTLNALNFYLNNGSRVKGFDEYGHFDAFVLKARQIINFRFYKENGEEESGATYHRYSGKTAWQFAQNAVSVLKSRLSEIDALSYPESMTQFKRLLIRAKDLLGFILEDELGHGLPLYEGQTEQEWDATMPDEAVRIAQIRMDGVDEISARFREANVWSREEDIPSNARGVYSYFTKKPRGFIEGPLKAGASDFVKYEVVNARFVSCGRSGIKVEGFTWILKDGSSFSYSPFIECE